MIEEFLEEMVLADFGVSKEVFVGEGGGVIVHKMEWVKVLEIEFFTHANK